MTSSGGWAEVEARIDRVVAASAFDPDTIENVRELVSLLKGRYPEPEIAKGYWNTIRLIWQTTDDGPVEVEVFADQLDAYRFEPTFSVCNELHRAGEPFTPKFIAALPAPIAAD